MSDISKDARICIIGAGPAGLSAGMYLEQKGYENYTILEREDHVGGKCHSPEYNGRRYEMGAIMGVPSYYAVHDIEKFCGFTHDGPKLNRNYKNLKGDVIEPFDPKKNPLRVPHLLKMRSQMKKFAELLETKYKGYDINGHRGVSEGRYDGYAVTPEREKVSGVNENLKDLALPFNEFCRINGVDLVKEIWIGPFTSFGYGYFDEIPAAYVLKYLDFQTTMNFVNVNLWTWKDGTQSIYERLNAKLKHAARLNSNITKVERKDDKVFVTVNGEVEEYDYIIVTAPLQYLPDYFDADANEKELFSKITYEMYDVLAFTTKPEDHPEISYYIFENMGDPEIPYDTCKETVLEDLKEMHNPAEKVHYEKDWYYFPHVDSKTYASGWYEKVEGMQGNKNTFYAGEVMSFGDMDETCEYSRELVDRFF